MEGDILAEIQIHFKTGKKMPDGKEITVLATSALDVRDSLANGWQPDDPDAARAAVESIPAPVSAECKRWVGAENRPPEIEAARQNEQLTRRQYWQRWYK